MGTISLTEWLTPTLIIAIIRVILLVLVGRISYYTFKLQSQPELRIQVRRCDHKVRYKTRARSSEIIGTELIVDFEIHNTGATTTINECGLKCRSLGNLYSTTEKVQSLRGIILEKGHTENYRHQFYINSEIHDNPLYCTFFLYHTHGKKKVKRKSNLRN